MNKSNDEIIFNKGRLDYFRGLEESQNPFSSYWNPVENDLWQQGWTDAAVHTREFGALQKENKALN